MAMLLRTRKHQLALGLKIICIVSVSFTYFIIGFISKETSSQTDLDFGNSGKSTSRHLLGIVKPYKNCTKAAINEFPSDGFTREQRQNGWICLHVFVVCYLFALLAVVCDHYFVPAVKKVCDNFQVKEDIAGATFMAIAGSSPELFINCVGTFVTEGDIGVGTIVGSAVFNVLAVPACCGLFANTVVYLDWWPISRDSLMYGISVILLIAFLQDGRIYFYEALTLVLTYTVYLIVLYFNNALMRAANRMVTRCRRKGHYMELMGESTPLLIRDEKTNGFSKILEVDFTLKDCEDLDESLNLWEWPRKQSKKKKFWWVITWPISLLLHLSIPDCRKYPRLYAVTFIMCVVWIGATSYLISWLITSIGDTLNIPDSVMGLTFLAAGMSVPEAVSGIIVTNQGHGSMGISSAIGSNTFDILLCLGIPWLIKTIRHTHTNLPGKHHWIKINSSGLNYSAISLLSTIVLLYFSVAHNKFRLNWKVGLTCLLMYIAFVVLASLIEMNVFFQVNLPICDR